LIECGNVFGSELNIIELAKTIGDSNDLILNLKDFLEKINKILNRADFWHADFDGVILPFKRYFVVHFSYLLYFILYFDRYSKQKQNKLSSIIIKQLSFLKINIKLL